MTLYQINEKLKEISLRHPFVQEYAEGDIYEYLNSGEHRYGLSFLTVDKVEVNDDFQTLQASLFYVDRLTNDGANRLQIQNTGISALQVILNELIEEVPSISVEMETYTVFTAQFADLCAGVYATISIRYENTDGLCEDVLEERIKTIEDNGEYEVHGYDKVEVNVPFIIPFDTKFRGSKWHHIPDSIKSGLTTTKANGYGMFKDCLDLREADISMPSTNLSEIFSGCRSITSVKITNKQEHLRLNLKSALSGCTSLKNVVIDGAPSNAISCFMGCSTLTSVSIRDTSHLLYADGMFYDCRSLTSLSIGIPSCMQGDCMFTHCTSLQELSLTSSSRLINHYDMFTGCSALTNLYLDILPNNNLTNLGLRWCTRLTEGSLMNIINALPTTTKGYTCTLGTTNLAKLTDEEISIAINKGWILN